jgi:hypothetical protein
VPTWLVMRARLWTSARRVEALERTQASALVAEATATAAAEQGEDGE